MGRGNSDTSSSEIGGRRDDTGPALTREQAAQWIAGASYGALLYHGTNRASDVASIRRHGFNGGGYGTVIFATSFAGEAHGYAQDNPQAVLEVAVRLDKPYLVEAEQNLGEVLRQDDFPVDPSPTGQQLLARAMIARGYDGLVVQRSADLRDPSDPYPARQIVRVFDPAKIKPLF